LGAHRARALEAAQRETSEGERTAKKIKAPQAQVKKLEEQKKLRQEPPPPHPPTPPPPPPPPPPWAAWWPAAHQPQPRGVSVKAAWETNRVRWETKEKERGGLQKDRGRTKAVRKALGWGKRGGGPRSVPGGGGLLAGHRHPRGSWDWESARYKNVERRGAAC
jgi:hypothetical protein